MHKNYITLLLVVLCFKVHSQSAQKSTLIKNITIITASEEKVMHQVGFVLVKDSKIAYVGKEKPEILGSYDELDGKGKFVTPGLIDSHVHLANTAGFNRQLQKEYPELVDAYFEQLPRSYLYHGFTTLIDVNNYNPKRINAIGQSPLHPDIYTCGNQVQVMDDFMMEMEEYPVDVRYQFPFLYDRYNRQIVFPDSIDLASHTPKRIISGIRNQGGIGVKLAYEDEASGLIVSWAKPGIGIIRELVLEAQKYSMPVLLHAPSLEGHEFGLKTGVQIFAHGLWNWSADPKDYGNTILTGQHKKVLSQIGQKQSGYQLTFRAITGEEDLIENNFGADKHLENVYPKGYLKLLQTTEGDWGRKKILGRAEFLKKTNPPFYDAIKSGHVNDEEIWPALYKIYKTRLNTVAKFLAENNANFILGSDTPAMNMFTNPPGYNGFLEMKHMYEAGIPLSSIFRAATYNNAKAFHLEEEFGSITRGKIANLLILNSDPLLDVDAYNDIDIVILQGKIIERTQLSALNY